MTTSERSLAETSGRYGRATVRRGYLLRHSVYTRVLHWLVAIFFILSLLTGFALYSPWLYRWIAPLFGGGATTRALHPWFSLLFTVFFAFQFVNWFGLMLWKPSDSRFMRDIKRFATNQDPLDPEDTEFFNGGQKAYFWIIAVSAILFLITGLLMWFDDAVPRALTAISYVVHDLTALVMLAGFIIHIYEGTAQQPGTFRSMIDGTVSDKWAWTHHPAWYRRVTGRDPRQAYEEALRKQRREDE